MPSYMLPQFNLGVDLWFPGNAPVAGPPDMIKLPCQPYLEPRPTGFVQIIAHQLHLPGMFIRLPIEVYTSLIGQPIVGGIFGLSYKDGTVHYYEIEWWEIAHNGFPNAYMVTYCFQCYHDGSIPDINR